MRAVALPILAILLAGCSIPDVPNTQDRKVEVIVSNQGTQPHWYDVTVRSGLQTVLHGNVTAFRPVHDLDADPQGADAGYAAVGAVRPGAYEVVVRSSGGPAVSRSVEVTTREVVYVSQSEQGDEQVVRIIVTTLGE